MAAKKKPLPKPKAPMVDPNRMASKSQVFAYLAESTGVSRKQVSLMFDALGVLMKAHLTKGCKVFPVPGLMKVTVVTKPATKARMGVNPFTGEQMMFKAKPARKVVKVRPLKGLKTMVA